MSTEDYDAIMATGARNDASSAISQQKFLAIEHAGINNKAFHQFITENWPLLALLQNHQLLNGNTLELKMNARLWLTPGNWASLDSDFYRVSAELICGTLSDDAAAKTKRQVRFDNTYKTLSEIAHQENLDKIKALRKIIRDKGDTILTFHFLTDLFAVVHMRAPRRALMTYVNNLTEHQGLQLGKVTGLLAKAIHAEANEQELRIENNQYPWSANPQENQAWHAYGGACYFTKDNETSQTRSIEVIKVPSQSIVDQYHCPSVARLFNPANYILQSIYPTYVMQVEEGTEKRSPQPLFWTTNDPSVVTRQKKLRELNCAEPKAHCQDVMQIECLAPPS